MNMDEVKLFDRTANGDLSKYAEGAGYNPEELTRGQVQARATLQQSVPSTLTTGYLYTNYRVLKYNVEKLLERN